MLAAARIVAGLSSLQRELRPEGRHGSHYVELAVITKNGQFGF